MNAKIDISGTTLYTKRLILRQWKESDLDDLYEYASVEGVGQMAGWITHKSKEESKEILNIFMKEKKTFAIELKENHKVIGSLGLEEHYKGIGEAYSDKKGREIGYVINKEYWGRELAPEAARRVIQYCFEELKLDFLACSHYETNKQSKRVIDKCNFHFLMDLKLNSCSFGTITSKLYVLDGRIWRRAYNYLKKDYMHHVSFIQVLRRGTAKIIKATEHGVFMRDTISGAYMLSTDDHELGKKWLYQQEKHGNYELMQICQRELMEYAKEYYKLANVLDCTQAVYTSMSSLACNYTLSFQEPDDLQMKEIRDIYPKLTDEELSHIRKLNQLFVGMVDGKMVGFIGSHLEGSIGLLEVFDAYQQKGYGTELETFMINKFLEWNLIPYAQIEIGNVKSEGLQKKLGMEFSTKRVYWLF